MGKADKSLEARFSELEDIQEILNLEAEYCYAADNQDPEAYASVFTEDGVLDVATMEGQVEGREALRQLVVEAFPQSLAFSIHCLHNPLVKVDGDTAKGKFYWQAPVTWKPTNEAVWQAGLYDDEYVRTDEGWKIKKKVVTFFYGTPYDKGWVKQQFVGTA